MVNSKGEDGALRVATPRGQVSALRLHFEPSEGLELQWEPPRVFQLLPEAAVAYEVQHRALQNGDAEAEVGQAEDGMESELMTDVEEASDGVDEVTGWQRAHEDALRVPHASLSPAVATDEFRVVSATAFEPNTGFVQIILLLTLCLGPCCPASFLWHLRLGSMADIICSWRGKCGLKAHGCTATTAYIGDMSIDRDVARETGNRYTGSRLQRLHIFE